MNNDSASNVAQNNLAIVAILATSLSLTSAPTAYAQFEESAIIDEIVITARKKDETLQQIPTSATAVGGIKVEQFGGNNLEYLAELTPNLVITRGSVSQSVAIRGLNTETSTGGFASAVGIGIDGQFFSQAAWLEIGTFDIKQFEVLRGPQGVYFGKNTTAGLINLVSNEPTEDNQGHITLGYETELDALRTEGAISGALSEAVRARLAIQHIEDDGWMDNIATAQPVEARDQDIVKLAIDWDVSDNISINSRTAFADSEVEGNASQLGLCGPGGLDTLANPVLSYQPFLGLGMAEDCVVDGQKTGGESRRSFDTRIQARVTAGDTFVSPNPADGGATTIPYTITAGGLVRSDSGNDERNIDNFSQSFQLDWDVNDETQVIAVTAYSDLTLDYIVDSDFVDGIILPTATPNTFLIPFGPQSAFRAKEDYTKFSQELRFQKTLQDNLDFVVGAYYENEDQDILDQTDFSVDSFGLFGSRNKFTNIERDSWALFGELNWAINDTLALIVGGRFTQENVEARTVSEIGSLGNPFDGDPTAIGGFTLFGLSEFDTSTDPAVPRTDRTADNFSPAITIQWDQQDNGTLYFSYKEGFKSGGFDAGVSGPLSLPNYEFDDEEVQAYELGGKWALDRLRLNAALYRSEYDNLQVSVFDGVVSTFTTNAGEATTQGLELEALWLASNELTVNAAIAYNDAEYDEFSGAACFTLQTAGCTAGEQNLSGRPLSLAPEWSGNLGIDWLDDIGDDFVLNLGLQVNYRDEQYLETSLDPDSLESSLTLINASIALSNSDDDWKATFIARNLTDEEYRTQVTPVPLFDASQVRLGTPATYELQLRYNLW